MAIVDYSYSQIESGFSGFFDDITNTGYRCFSTRGMWCGIITGTEASMHVWAGGDYPYSVIVDGSFSATPIISSGRITLFSGLSDAPHLVSIHVQGAYAPIYNAIRESWTDALRVDGAVPAFTPVPVTIPNDPSANILNSQPSIAWTGDNSNVRPTWTTTATNYTEGDTKALGMVIFRAQCSDIYVYASSQNFRYSVDGGTIQSVSLTGSTTGQARLLPLATGLDDTAVHEYRIWPDETSGSTAYIHGVAAFDDGVLVSLSSIDDKTHIAQFGDSITAAEGATTGACDCWLYGNENDYLITQCGVSGDTSSQVASRLPDYIDEISMPDYALLATGRNDDMDVEATFKAGYVTLCNAVETEGIPATICRGQLPGTASATAIANLEEWIQEVIASYTGFDFLDTSDWDPAATADGLHPTAAGYITINGDEAPALSSLISGGTTYDETVSESITITDYSVAALTMAQLISETVNLADATSGPLTIPTSVAEALAFTDAVSTTAIINITLAESLALLDAASTGGTVIDLVVDEAFTLSDAADANKIINEIIAESVNLADAATGALDISITVDESLPLSDQIVAIATFNLVLAEALELRDAISSGETVEGGLKIVVTASSGNIRVKGAIPTIRVTCKSGKIRVVEEV